VLPCVDRVTLPEKFPHWSTCPSLLDWPDLLIVVSVECVSASVTRSNILPSSVCP